MQARDLVKELELFEPTAQVTIEVEPTEISDGVSAEADAVEALAGEPVILCL